MCDKYVYLVKHWLSVPQVLTMLKWTENLSRCCPVVTRNLDGMQADFGVLAILGIAGRMLHGPKEQKVPNAHAFNWLDQERTVACML